MYVFFPSFCPRSFLLGVHDRAPLLGAVPQSFPVRSSDRGVREYLQAHRLVPTALHESAVHSRLGGKVRHVAHHLVAICHHSDVELGKSGGSRDRIRETIHYIFLSGIFFTYFPEYWLL